MLYSSGKCFHPFILEDKDAKEGVLSGTTSSTTGMTSYSVKHRRKQGKPEANVFV
jgi:hypothetical protein